MRSSDCVTKTRYSGVFVDSVRDRLWGKKGRLHGEVNAIMESRGLLEQWENYADLHGYEHWAKFVEQHFSGEPSAREALLSRCEGIVRLAKEWQGFYYGLKGIVKDEKQKQKPKGREQ
jgi:hypothetical protein